MLKINHFLSDMLILRLPHPPALRAMQEIYSPATVQ